MNTIDSKPFVSFLIFCFNHKEYIESAIESAYSQDYDNYEILIRDDCSTDNSVANINNAITKYSNTGKKIKTYTDFGSKNIGLINSYNKLFYLAKGNIICALSGDDIATPDRVKKIVDAFSKYNVDLVATNATVINANREIIKSEFYDKTASIFKFAEYKGNNIFILKNIKWNLVSNYVFGGFSIAIRKSILNDYNQALPNNLKHEDGFLSFLALINNGAIFINENLLFYRRHNNNLWKIFNSNDVSFLQKYINYKIYFFNPFYQEKINYVQNKLLKTNSYYKNRNKLKRTFENQITINNILYNNFCKNEKSLISQFVNFKVLCRNLFHISVFKLSLKGLSYLFVPFFIKNKLTKQLKNPQLK